MLQKVPKLLKMVLFIGINIVVSALLILMCKDQSNLAVVIVCGVLFRICNVVLIIQVVIVIIYIIKVITKKRE